MSILQRESNLLYDDNIHGGILKGSDAYNAWDDRVTRDTDEFLRRAMQDEQENIDRQAYLRGQRAWRVGGAVPIAGLEQREAECVLMGYNAAAAAQERGLRPSAPGI